MKVYTKTYNINYAAIAKANPPLSVPANKKVCFAIPFPSEGFLARLVVYQATGTPCNFEVELLNSKVPYAPGIYNLADLPADALTPYRVQMPVTGPLSQVAGQVLSLADDNYGIGFRNIDGGFTLNERKLYLLIQPTSGEQTSWNVTLQCHTKVG